MLVAQVQREQVSGGLLLTNSVRTDNSSLYKISCVLKQLMASKVCWDPVTEF